MRSRATCHPDRENNYQGLCGVCRARQRFQTDPVHRKYVLDHQRAWRQSHPENYQRQWGKANRQKVLKRFKITLEQYDTLLKLQDRRCGICNIQLMFKDQHLDHNHITNKIRGFLCSRHNLAIGLFDDSQDLLRKAIVYLDNPPIDQLSS